MARPVLKILFFAFVDVVSECGVFFLNESKCLIATH